MQQVKLRYRVRISDFREASYYALFLRRRNVFRAVLILLLAFFVYAVLCFHQVMTMEPLALFAAASCLIWILLQLAEAERGILRYSKSPDSLIDAQYEAEFSGRQFSIGIPESNFHVSGKTSDFPYAFEIAHCFLLYATNQQLFIIPTRDMSKEEALSLRMILREALGGRFHSLFGRKR